MSWLKRLFNKIRLLFKRNKSKDKSKLTEVVLDNYNKVHEDLVSTNSSYTEVAADRTIGTSYLLASRLDRYMLGDTSSFSDFSMDNVSDRAKDFYVNCDIDDMLKVVKWLSGLEDFNIDIFRYNSKVIILGLLFEKFNLNVELVEDFLIKGLRSIYDNNDKYIGNSLNLAVSDRITLIASINNIPDAVLQRATYMYCYIKKSSRVDILLACKDYIGFMDSNLDWRDIDIINSNI